MRDSLSGVVCQPLGQAVLTKIKLLAALYALDLCRLFTAIVTGLVSAAFAVLALAGVPHVRIIPAVFRLPLAAVTATLLTGYQGHVRLRR
jgi:hypothetical protein